jgi:hypothetical protein
MSIEQAGVRVTRWSGPQNPSMSAITKLMQAEGLRPYMWMNMPNHRYGVRSHGYKKVLFVLEGMIEIQLPDSNQQVRLRAGDRIDIAPYVRHNTIVGQNGAKCVEAAAAGVKRN